MIKTILRLIALITLTTSCVSLIEDAPIVKTYRLNLDQIDVRIIKNLSVPISIGELRLNAGLSTERIALTYQQNKIMDYFADAKWNDEIDIILRNIFIDIFENRKLPSKNGIDDKKSYKAYSLNIFVKDFQAEYIDSPFTNPPTVNVAIKAILFEKGNNQILKEFSLSKRVPAKANKIIEVTSAFQYALESVLVQLNEEIANI